MALKISMASSNLSTEVRLAPKAIRKSGDAEIFDLPLREHLNRRLVIVKHFIDQTQGQVIGFDVGSELDGMS